MDASRNLYAILGVPPEATQEHIREAYRVLARRFHPDANLSEGADLHFREVATAFEVLGDPHRRVEYDALRREYLNEPRYLTLRVTPSKRVLSTLKEPQVLYLLVEIVAMRQPAVQKRRNAPLNLTLVLDRSSSMRGARLDKVKVAAHEIIEQLSASDILSVVSFSDRADVLIPAGNVTEKTELRSSVSIMRADGGTEIYHGLAAGLEQCRRYLGPRLVNHIILLTDGRTFGDEDRCLELAQQAAEQGIGISAMGIGEEWNDSFLDSLASMTGGTSAYINSPGAVVRFLNDRVRSLGDTFAERLALTIAPDADVTLESVFRLSPSPQPVNTRPQPIPIGALEYNRTAALLIQFQMPPSSRTGFRTVACLDVTGDILSVERQRYAAMSDISIEIAANPPPEDPSPLILDALGKLTLYRMQQKAEQALAEGNVAEASRRLENLATRMLASGQEELAQMAIAEARRVALTGMLSEEGRKSIKYGTRHLLALSQSGGEGR